jgi:hypothetical protein
MTIDWQVIPHREQRYPTVGDWWLDGDSWHFRISNLNDFRYEALVFMHELIEFVLCMFLQVAPDKVDAFDKQYEDARSRNLITAPCGCILHDEPGDDPHAPYHRPHQAADLCEYIVAKFMGVTWQDYCRRVDEVFAS